MNDFSLRPYIPSDAKAVVDVINADSFRTLGLPRAVVDGVGNVRMIRYVPPSSDKAVALDGTGNIIGYAYVADKENGIVTEVGGSVHPNHWDKGVGSLLLAWAEERAGVLANQAPSGVRCVLQSNVFESESNAIQLFVDSGYGKMREWVHMVLEMESSFAAPSLPSGLTLREMDLDYDWEIVGPAMDDAFADHWGVIQTSLIDAAPIEEQEAESEEEDTPSDDSFSNAPGYCFIALDGDRVTGGILCNAKLVERTDTGRVGSVFVRAEYRRRGIGQALMKTAFNKFWSEGVKRIILDTDSESFSQSTKFYGGLGMKIYRREFLFEKEIRAGREVRRLVK